MNYQERSVVCATADEVHAGVLSALSGHANVAVVAGHFMLMYDDLAETLVPMVYRDSDNPRVVALSREMAGDFPVRTFQHGVTLAQGLRSTGHEARIALLVNDHIFQTNGWRPQNLDDHSRARNLRHAYYRRRQPVPSSYLRHLAKMNLTVDQVLLDNNSSVRSRTDTIPKMSLLFSEQTMRGVFQKETCRELVNFPGFTVKKAGGVTSLHFREPGAANLMCLADEQGCGCSGEIVEFLVTLSQRGFNAVTIYVPHECWDAARAGVVASLHLPVSIREHLSRVILIGGFGGVASLHDRKEGYSMAACSVDPGS
jgi:hypothetical protein